MTTVIAPPHPPADPALRQRDYLLRVAQALNADLDLPAVLARVIRTAVTMTAGQAGAIALRQPDAEMRVVASFQLEPRFEHFLSPLLDPDTPAAADPKAERGGVPRTGDRLREPMSPEPSGRTPARTPPGAAAPLARVIPAPPAGIAIHAIQDSPDSTRQILTLPLQIGDAAFGRIFVFRSEGAAAFTPLDGDLLKTFADQAAIAIQNAETHMRLRARERRLAALVEHSPAGSLLLDAAGRVVSFNPAALGLSGRGEAELAGAAALDLLVLEDERGQVLVLDLPGAADAPVTVQGYLRRADGSPPPYVQLTLTPLPAPRGDRTGFVVDIVDLGGFKAAEDAGRSFLAGLSHELKTPLALIRGFAETLRLPQVRADEQLADEALDVILDETGHLTDMVDRLLLAARLQAGALTLDRHVLDVASELGRVVATFERAYPDRDWSFTVADGLPTITADPVRLREVAENLLANAVKYSDAGTPIRVDASPAEAGAAIRIRVRDQGIGIPPEDQPRVFDRFVRATERGEGTGLGLYMSRAIVEAHGGQLAVESASGQGSTFTVTLPSALPDEAPR